MELVSNFIIKSNDSDFILEKRIKLLCEIEKTGSILQAAKNVPMSYKAAWDAIDLMNNLSSHTLVERKAGGKSGGGSHLSEYAKNLIKSYELIKIAQKDFLDLVSKNTDFDSGYIKNLQRIAMQISARNVFVGKVSKIASNDVNAEVVLSLKGAQEIASIITKNSMLNLELEVGKEAKAIIKSSSVMISATKDIQISARNVLEGVINKINSDEINAEVSLDIGENQILTAVITANSIKKLGLKVGDKAYGIIKSTSVMIGL
ncbi:TOBE domain-containing protein [Campylobacter geochelonis]|uniref:ModE family transcriptional regulator n=1 Tax=Campylobacter geochelonis TaxID=1780362 RepID=A0A128ELF2_9BACT|nr:TOBE domain-containing protein [Campylobacter geochelonis]QKF71191.1 transcriptional regulator, ModE family [Campylobacter geochelonis]CZE48805.1 ModE family transcriptional regulator [Campylobacter geochelonis]CZE48835.1 ModE family transcriptional regulator [Campylobacter geochelonis]CZE49997.1 ModE family transcriptional regulator [Campylobacter geochelonis]